MKTKFPAWFRVWLDNDYAHLTGDVSGIKRDVAWIKWLTGFILAALITAAIAIITIG